MQSVWCQVSAVRPHNGSKLGIYGDCSKEGDIPKRLEDWAYLTRELGPEIDDASGAVGETNPEAVLT